MISKTNLSRQSTPSFGRKVVLGKGMKKLIKKLGPTAEDAFKIAKKELAPLPGNTVVISAKKGKEITVRAFPFQKDHNNYNYYGNETFAYLQKVAENVRIRVAGENGGNYSGFFVNIGCRANKIAEDIVKTVKTLM